MDVLKSDAKYAGKQYACRELSIIGTEQSVPVLAGMLTNQEYSDMARYALERIPGEAVDKALLAALPKAEGKAKIGIVNSLGERGCKSGGRRRSPSSWTTRTRCCAGAAISALGKIGGPDAVKALDKALASAPDNQKMPVYDAYLKIAEKMVAEGNKAEAHEDLHWPEQAGRAATGPHRRAEGHGQRRRRGNEVVTDMNDVSRDQHHGCHVYACVDMLMGSMPTRA